MRILIVDNYDSFTYNLQHLFAKCEGVENVDVKRNDDDFLQDIEKGKYDAVVISPGPGSPDNPNYFGLCRAVIEDFGTKGLPILGVCLGFQGITSIFGASLKRSNIPIHGKTSRIHILAEDALFRGIPQSIDVMRYHSLMVDTNKPIPDHLIVTAVVSDDDDSSQENGQEIMAIRHKAYPIHGVQFHPESFGTEYGLEMIRNFVKQYS